MNRKRVLAAMQSEAVRERKVRRGPGSTPVVVLAGQNPRTVRSLQGRDLTVRYFPFYIGRAGSDGASPLEEPDLLIEDRRPHHLSQLQVAFERRDGEVFIVDPGSRHGSAVGDVPLGGVGGGKRELLMAPGTHRIRMGGEKSPYVLTANVLSDDEFISVHEQIRFGGRDIPVSVLYERLCRYVGKIFKAVYEDGRRSMKMAVNLVGSVLKYPEIIDPLYYFSAIPETQGDRIVAHSLNVMICTVKLAASMPVPEEDISRLALAALFHDIGMYEIPPEIVNKREVIDPTEYEIIKTHSREGKSRLEEIHGTDPLLITAALEHHERIDGTGYPGGIRDLSKYVELIGMVDFFEALTHDRPQRGPFTPHEGMRMLINLRRAIFSPDALKCFINAFSLFPVYSIVRLNTGEIGQVVRTHRNRPLRPVVRLFFDRCGRFLDDGKRIDLHSRHRLYIAKDISDRVFVDHYFRL